MTINFHREAAAAFGTAQPDTRAAATPVLEMLSSGFQVTWFREQQANLWTAIIKADSDTGSHFGLRQECLVIGNGHAKDFHQRTLNLRPPDHLADRTDDAVRFIASEAPFAEALCAAWGQKNRCSVVLIRLGDTAQYAAKKDKLYALLSAALWRRDVFAEAEPVRDPSEFFGRQLVINKLLAKIMVGAPVAVFGLRKIGKSSLLGRLEDLLAEDSGSVTATAFLIGNTTVLTAGRWWDMARLILQEWQLKLKKLAHKYSSKINAKADKLGELLAKNTRDSQQLAMAFEKDVASLLKAARALKSELDRDSVRLIFILDECDHLYPHLPSAGYWRRDFFEFWNTIQAIKRRLDSPDEIVYVLSGVNPSGVEQGALLDEPNPLYEMQREYLGPMDPPDAAALLTGLGDRMGLIFEPEAIERTYELVGGHPLLLRRLGTAVHELFPNRSAKRDVSRRDVERAFGRKKRDLFNQVAWFLEHLAKVAPDEERLLRDIARGGAQAYGEYWKDNEFRETFAYHLERYGLISFRNDLPEVSLSLIREALQRPAASEFVEQKKLLKDAVEAIETAVRIRLRIDIEKDREPMDAVRYTVQAIPTDAKNRALNRQELTELGEVAGLGAVLESLNWGDYEILLEKNHDTISWVGDVLEKSERIAVIKQAFSNAHIVRHNNDHALKELIDQKGFDQFYESFRAVREMVSA